VHEPPADVTGAEVLRSVREHWLADADEVEHLPVGFGAHHWAASVAGRRRLFVSLDRLGSRRTAAALEGAYAGAADLAAQGLEFVLPPLPASSGTFTVPLGRHALSATAWHDGCSGAGPHEDDADAAASARRLGRLHAARVGPQVPRWAPLVPPSLGDDLAALAAGPWDGGPHGTTARAALVPALGRVAAWTERYHRLATATDPATWVPTHGEPHTRNLLRTADGDLVVDWESLRVAPRERDLSTLLASGPAWRAAYPWPDGAAGPDGSMVELFDLEWRLDEIAQYAAYFAGPHADDEDARTSLGGLRHELDRPPGPGAEG
jgi:spectinomycin phosphotransferase